jgi:hypothetical protein
MLAIFTKRTAEKYPRIRAAWRKSAIGTLFADMVVSMGPGG